MHVEEPLRGGEPETCAGECQRYHSLWFWHLKNFHFLRFWLCWWVSYMHVKSEQALNAVLIFTKLFSTLPFSIVSNIWFKLPQLFFSVLSVIFHKFLFSFITNFSLLDYFVPSVEEYQNMFGCETLLLQSVGFIRKFCNLCSSLFVSFGFLFSSCYFLLPLEYCLCEMYTCLRQPVCEASVTVGFEEGLLMQS